MIKYIKDSIRELKHVVWPTREETNNYFLTVVLVLLAFGIYLFLASTFFTKSLFGLKDLINGDNQISNIQDITKKLDLDTKNIYGEVKVTSKTQSNKIKLIDKKNEVKTTNKVEEIKTETTK